MFDNKLGFLHAFATSVINNEPTAIACVMTLEDGTITLWHGSGAEVRKGMKTLLRRLHKMEIAKEGDSEAAVDEELEPVPTEISEQAASHFNGSNDVNTGD